MVFHRTMTVVWGLLLVPTLAWWRESVWWIAVMSLYANMVGHWSAAQAAESEDAQARESGTRGAH